ncbi:hypothetical protein IQ07DRAFT_665206 [Pyrenochaeta sp. DS3sAY3a]|nr:hypothetical protein IQ07DRAFT_665206 [Pyrenochaeta sp. DS3sAY3a]
MAQTQDTQSRNTIHFLHFTYDCDDRSSLTLLANDVRFHIEANPSALQKSSEKAIYHEYLDKLHALRSAEKREHDAAGTKKPASSTQKQSERSDKDSAVDVTADEEVRQDPQQDSLSAEHDLRMWLLSSLTDVIEESAPPDRAPEPSSIHDWYHGPTYFYELVVQDGKLTPQLLEGSEDLDAQIEDLVPRLKMPQYIQKIAVPWMNAHGLTVQSEVAFPEPAHPGKVTDASGAIFFFKPVVPDQPGPTKREIAVLQKIEKLGLDIKVPKLLGFVGVENSCTEAMGFLLSHIERPVPLTEVLASSVAEWKREGWSKKSKYYVDTLHKHGIIWGDAKADNFIVDEDDELWIIDFGGSYTEGWIDPEISDTKEGDDQGLEKVQDVLLHPEDERLQHGNATPNPAATVRETASSLFVTEAPTKRGHDGEEDYSTRPPKRGRRESSE